VVLFSLVQAVFFHRTRLSGRKHPLSRFVSLFSAHSQAILIVKGEPFMDQKKIGAFLKALRKEKELTQEELAQQLHVSSRTVSRWETGSNMPDISLLIEIAEFYDVSIPEIVAGERKNEAMNEATKEVARTLSEYAENEKENILRKIRWESLLGVCALAVYAALDITGLALKNNFLSSLSTLSLTLVFVTTMIIPLYATGLISKLQKRRKPSSLPLPLKLLLAVIVGYAGAWLIKLVFSFLPFG